LECCKNKGAMKINLKNVKKPEYNIINLEHKNKPRIGKKINLKYNKINLEYIK